MLAEKDIIKMIFGFKVKYLRQQADLSYHQLAERTGLSTSYLNDIEKGKKYPKVDKIASLAAALGVDYDFLVSTQASKKLQPVVDLLSSEFMKEFPLERFGISPEKLFELFSSTPDKVNAFISTILKITRNYQMQREHLYLAALRSFQDMHDNYFEDLETGVRDFRSQHGIPAEPPYSTDFLEGLLREVYGVAVDRIALPREGDLHQARSYYSRRRKILFLNAGLSSAQENFLLGRELGFQYLGPDERPYLTRPVEIDSFDKLLNNFRASYFSVALLMDSELVAADFRRLAEQPDWDADRFLALLPRYDVTAEMLLQRLTNILPQFFGLKDLFFIRLTGDPDLRFYRMTKELHLSRLHNPYANELSEHYCRRWVSVNIIKQARARQQLSQDPRPVADAQISQYWQTPNAYLCLSIARTDPGNPTDTASVTVGVLLNERSRQLLRFLSDPKLPTRIVNTTCERCGITDCEARAAAPVALERQQRLQRVREAAERLEKG